MMTIATLVTMMNIEMSIKQSDEAGMNGTHLCCKEMKELSGTTQSTTQANVCIPSVDETMTTVARMTIMNNEDEHQAE